MSSVLEVNPPGSRSPTAARAGLRLPDRTGWSRPRRRRFQGRCSVEHGTRGLDRPSAHCRSHRGLEAVCFHLHASAWVTLPGSNAWVATGGMACDTVDWAVAIATMADSTRAEASILKVDA